MGLNFQKKEQVVSKISKVILEGALSAVVASLDGITANELTNLRSQCRRHGVCLYVVRNTLLFHIFSDTAFKSLCPLFFGSNIIGISTVEVSDCAKIFVKFSKECYDRFKIKGAVFDGVFIEASKISVLSSLPTYQDSVMRLIFVIRESAIGKLIRLLRVISNYKK